MNKAIGKNSIKGVWKKALSWILMMSMTISLTAAFVPVTAMAATQTTAKGFMDNTQRKTAAQPERNQCVELYNQYIETVFGKTASQCQICISDL